jgi:hypothetical protein
MPIPSWKTELKEVAPNVFTYIQGGDRGSTTIAGTPLATIDPKEIRKARESYLARKGTASTSSAWTDIINDIGSFSVRPDHVEGLRTDKSSL